MDVFAPSLGRTLVAAIPMYPLLKATLVKQVLKKRKIKE